MSIDVPSVAAMTRTASPDDKITLRWVQNMLIHLQRQHGLREFDQHNRHMAPWKTLDLDEPGASQELKRRIEVFTLHADDATAGTEIIRNLENWARANLYGGPDGNP